MTRIVSGPMPSCERPHVASLVTIAANGAEVSVDLASFAQAVRRGERFFLADGDHRFELLPAVCPDCLRLTIATV